MKNVSLSLTNLLNDGIEDLVNRGEFDNKSQLIRYVLSEYIKEDIELLKNLEGTKSA